MPAGAAQGRLVDILVLKTETLPIAQAAFAKLEPR